MTREATPGEGTDRSDGSRTLLLALSNAMVRIYKEQFGRGPTKARADWAGPNAILCTLEHTFTPAEQKLVDLGEHQRLRDGRTFMQYASRDRFVEVTEEVTGRKVRAFVSGVDTSQDVSVEVFYLEPEEEPE